MTFTVYCLLFIVIRPISSTVCVQRLIIFTPTWRITVATTHSTLHSSLLSGSAYVYMEPILVTVIIARYEYLLAAPQAQIDLLGPKKLWSNFVCAFCQTDQSEVRWQVAKITWGVTASSKSQSEGKTKLETNQKVGGKNWKNIISWISSKIPGSGKKKWWQARQTLSLRHRNSGLCHIVLQLSAAQPPRVVFFYSGGTASIPVAMDPCGWDCSCNFRWCHPCVIPVVCMIHSAQWKL